MDEPADADAEALALGDAVGVAALEVPELPDAPDAPAAQLAWKLAVLAAVVFGARFAPPLAPLPEHAAKTTAAAVDAERNKIDEYKRIRSPFLLSQAGLQKKSLTK
jgi:hypothetical protein